jgi:hypothetical protein
VGVEGLTEYDPDGVDARAIKEIIEGVHVIRLGKYRLTTKEAMFDGLVLSILQWLNSVSYISVLADYTS